VSACEPGPDAPTYARLLPIFSDAQERIAPVLAALRRPH
jgi:hypothetical protein